MKLIYVAGKYRGKTEAEIFDNIIHARNAAYRLWEKGYAVICPHLNSAFMGNPAIDDHFIKGDLEILSRCDAIYMLRNWLDSDGARREFERASQLGEEIYYEENGD